MGPYWDVNRSNPDLLTARHSFGSVVLWLLTASSKTQNKRHKWYHVQEGRPAIAITTIKINLIDFKQQKIKIKTLKKNIVIKKEIK